MPFYIGKGKNGRAWDHLKRNDNQNINKQKTIQAIRDLGYEPIVNIIYDNLYEFVALRIEAYLIDKYKNTITNIKKPGYKSEILVDSIRIERPKRYERPKIIVNQ